MPTTILVTGAANGLGAAFVEAYRHQDQTQVFAIDREQISCTQENVKSWAVDVTEESSIDSFVRDIKDQPIDLVLHSAGIRGLVPHLEQEKHGDVDACETMEVMDFATLTRTFNINAAGTFMLFRAIMSNLLKAKDPKVIVMSSRMGSLGNNFPGNRSAGSAYAYRPSKAALNAIIRSFVVDVPEVTFIVCHPGRVETKLVKWKEEGAITAQESVEGLLPLIDRWGKEDSGKFYDRFGETIQW
ncbi:NAD(P)-binding protein [Hortaea werneckii]|nr:NAD(P)-binding protein [Hortaea werneckii]